MFVGMLAEGTVLQNRYRVERLLGRGGMGAVYEAYDERFGNRVALKQAEIVEPELGRAFEREARLLRTLRHRALPVVIDYFDEGGAWYLVMDYVEGEDLGARLKRAGGPLPLEEVLAWGDQVLGVLEYLHAHDPPVVHRDIKPQNLKLTPQGNVVLLDFGLSKGAAFEGTGPSGEKSIVGYTPHYAPLEQIHGVGTDPRSDLYALAATLYTLATGKKPPDAGFRAAATAAGSPDPLVPADALNPIVPPAVADVLQTALSPNPNARPQTAAAMRAALDAASREPAAGEPARSAPTPIRRARPIEIPIGDGATDAAGAEATRVGGDDVETRVRPRPPAGTSAPAIAVTARPAPHRRSLGAKLAISGALGTGLAALVIGYALSGGFREPVAPPPAPPPVANVNAVANTNVAPPVEEPEPEPARPAVDEPPLSYQEFRSGRGRSPRPGDRVFVYYVGMLADGTVFDDGHESDEPFVFTYGTGEVIEGWEQGLATMKVGGHRRIVVPPSLGFGDEEVDGVPPGSTLVYDVRMVGLESPSGRD
jgi:hypothetical protein